MARLIARFSLALALAGFALTPTAARAALQPQGAPVVLDDAGDCLPGDPSIAALRGGGFVVAWSDGVSLSTRRLDAAGRPAAPVVVVVSGHVTDAKVVAFDNGGYALAWFDGHRMRVLARFFESSGTAAGPEMEVASAGLVPAFPFGGLDAVQGPGGTLAIAWTNGRTAWLREMHADGTGLSAPFAVSVYSPTVPSAPALVSPALIVGPDGTFRLFWVVGWQVDGTVSPYGYIQGSRVVRDAAYVYHVTRVLDPGGSGRDPEAAMAGDGGYLLAWAAYDSYGPPAPVDVNPIVVGTAYGADDEPRDGGHFIADLRLTPAGAVAVAATPSGGFVVAWESNLAVDGTGGTIVLARELDASGVPRDAPRRLAPEGSTVQRRPDLAFAGDGLLVSVWQDGGDPDGGVAGCDGRHVLALPFRLTCGDDAVCVLDGRFELTLTWADPRRQLAGVGHPVALTGETAYFWFFAPDAVEVIVKVLDGRGINGNYWVFWGGLTDLGLRLTVRDTVTGATRTYETAPGTMVSAADTSAWPQGTASADGAQADASAARASRTAFPAQPLRQLGADRDAFAGDVDIETAQVNEPAFTESLARAGSLADSTGGPCSPTELPAEARPGLCLNGARFEVEATWRDFAGHTGQAEAVALGDDGGWFSFFDHDNVELVVKVLDGRAVNGRFWVFYGALTNVEYDLVVRNVATGATWTRHNPSGAFQSGADVDALAP